MEPTVVQKSLDRMISQKAMQMSSSSVCKIWVVGFLCGVCITYLLVAAITSFKDFGSQIMYLPPQSDAPNSSSLANLIASVNTNKKENYSSLVVPAKITRHGTSEEVSKDERVNMLYSAWSAILDEPVEKADEYLKSVGLKRSNVLAAPHLEDCESAAKMNEQFDRHQNNGSLPPWLFWKGPLGLELLRGNSEMHTEQMQTENQQREPAAYPPWIVGSDEDNFPLTRRVQRDLWMHQHPENCSDEKLRFLVTDWERIPGFGMGAQFAGMCALLAIAINENRILVTNYYNRADHDGCTGSQRSSWSCYFFPETSAACRSRALSMLKSKEAWSNAIVTSKDNYTSKEIWTGKIPRHWGTPWNQMQPTTEIDGSLLLHHRKMDCRWWRAQALRYLMRFKTRYMCNLMNVARHSSFGLQTAKMVAENLAPEWPQVLTRSESPIEQLVWSNHRPWIPRPLLSMHVRMGDKACEMKVVGFENYMQLAERIRNRFPNLKDIWLSTEMQEVIDKSRLYEKWNFYYSNVSRQTDNSTMASYEASLGREMSTNYPMVNFLMASDADFFVGALGSTWCFLIDGMRNTGGKVLAGYLSVNKDRFW